MTDKGICPHCGKEGAHFAPPSMGEEGFYICDTAVVKSILQVQEITKVQEIPDEVLSKAEKDYASAYGSDCYSSVLFAFRAGIKWHQEYHLNQKETKKMRKNEKFVSDIERGKCRMNCKPEKCETCYFSKHGMSMILLGLGRDFSDEEVNSLSTFFVDYLGKYQIKKDRIKFHSDIFGETTKPSDGFTLLAQDIVSKCPVAVFQVLNKHLNDLGFCLAIKNLNKVGKQC